MTAENYVGISIPTALMEDVDRIIMSGNGGYKSRAEFLKDAARQLLLKINNNNYKNNNYQQREEEKIAGGE